MDLRETLFPHASLGGRDTHLTGERLEKKAPGARPGA